MGVGIGSPDVVLCTLTELPWLVSGASAAAGPHVQLGSVVGARTVKFLARLHASSHDTDTRDNWWSELREEVRSNARALNCTHVFGYVHTIIFIIFMTEYSTILMVLL